MEHEEAAATVEAGVATKGASGGILISSNVHVEDKEVADGDNDKEDNNHDDRDGTGAEYQEGSVDDDDG